MRLTTICRAHQGTGASASLEREETIGIDHEEEDFHPRLRHQLLATLHALARLNKPRRREEKPQEATCFLRNYRITSFLTELDVQRQSALSANRQSPPGYN